jgi:hypothetical protein
VRDLLLTNLCNCDCENRRMVEAAASIAIAIAADHVCYCGCESRGMVDAAAWKLRC